LVLNFISIPLAKKFKSPPVLCIDELVDSSKKASPEPLDLKVIGAPLAPSSIFKVVSAADPDINTLPPYICSLSSGLLVPIPTLPLENTSNTGTPEISATEKREPERLSVTENNCP